MQINLKSNREMASTSDATYTINNQKLDGLDFEVGRLYENLFNVLSKPLSNTSPSQIRVLQETKEKCEMELNEARIALAASQQKVDKLTEEYESLKKLSEEMIYHDQAIAQKKAELENQLVMLQNTKINSHDEELVEKTKLKYKYIRDITQVRFSYNKLNEDIVEGYVYNKVTKKVLYFTINLSELDSEQVRERLLKLMKDSSHPSYAAIPLE